MNSHSTRFVLSAVLVAFCVSATHAQTSVTKPAVNATKYTVKFNAPDKVGRQFRMFVKQNLNMHVKSSAMGRVLQETQESSTAELIAVATVLKVSANNITQKQSMVIEKCVKTVKGVPQTLLPKGTTVVAAVEGAVVNFYVNGRRVNKELQETLNDLSGMDSNGQHDEDMFEPDGPKAVGEMWPIKVQQAVNELRRMKVAVAPQHVRGTVKLASVSKVGGEEFLNVTSSIQVSAFAVPMPPGARLASSDVKGTFASKLPVNSALLPPEQTMHLTAAFVMKVKPDAATPEIIVNTVAATSINMRLEDLGMAAPKAVASLVK